MACADKTRSPKPQSKDDPPVVGKRSALLVASVSREPPPPDDQRLPPLEMTNLQFLVATNRICTFIGHAYNMQLASNDLQIPLHRLGFPISSEPLRYAVLAHASFKRTGHQS